MRSNLNPATITGARAACRRASRSAMWRTARSEHRLQTAMDNHYTRTAITLHWVMALLIFTTFPLGVYMHDLPISPDKLRLYSYHKWIQGPLFLLGLFRILWGAPPPPTPSLQTTP